MVEYIECEAVLKIIGDNCPHDKGGYNTEEEMGAGVACYYIRKDVDNIPTADVVPKSEVEKIFAEIESKLILNKAIHCGQKFYYIRLEDDIAELKKKYTEGEDKPATEEKHFSPEDVSKMTHQEITENYTAIRKSMERW